MGIKRGMSWPVNIEEDSDTKGLYRLAPYSGKNPIAELFGSSDDSSYMVIHAEDPAKVWMEDFDSYDQYYCFTHMVPESGWEGEAAEYGTLSDGIISFPAMCMATIDLTDPEGLWHSATREGECKIVIPGSGSEIEDYSLYLDYNYCGVNNKVPVTITAGSSVKSVKYVLQEGLVEADSKTETNADLDAATMQLVAAEGKEIAAGKQTVECSVHGLHSMLVIAMDADGKAHTGKVAYIYMETGRMTASGHRSAKSSTTKICLPATTRVCHKSNFRSNFRKTRILRATTVSSIRMPNMRATASRIMMATIIIYISTPRILRPYGSKTRLSALTSATTTAKLA